MKNYVKNYKTKQRRLCACRGSQTTIYIFVCSPRWRQIVVRTQTGKVADELSGLSVSYRIWNLLWFITEHTEHAWNLSEIYIQETEKKKF